MVNLGGTGPAGFDLPRMCLQGIERKRFGGISDCNIFYRFPYRQPREGNGKRLGQKTQCRGKSSTGLNRGATHPTDIGEKE